VNTEAHKSRNKILIAEDDPVSRRRLEALLKKWGYEVVSVGDGLDALHVLEAEDPPALAILDWMMPGLEGPQICLRVRELQNRPYTYIVLLTARTQQGDLLRGLESGADGYLTKPYDAEELRARLHVGGRILDLHDRLVAAREELRFRATHDELTGLRNRSTVLRALQRECARQSREGGSLSVILMDLDHFKQVNDTYGHLCGDAVMKETAQRISSCVRPYDTVGRYGGEEFLIVVPSSDALGAMAMAERIRLAIESAPMKTDEATVAMTASFGLIASSGHNPLSPQMLVRLADEAMYRAKSQGRNRCELASVPEPTSTSCAEAVSAPVRTESH